MNINIITVKKEVLINRFPIAKMIKSFFRYLITALFISSKPIFQCLCFDILLVS